MATSSSEKQAIRLRQLTKLREAYKTKNDAEFAGDILGVLPNYYSRLKSGQKKIGDACREWESKNGLPVGWFDVDENALPPTVEIIDLTSGAIDIAKMWDSLNKDSRLYFEREMRKAAEGQSLAGRKR